MQLADLTDFITANQSRPVPLIAYTLAIAAIVWGVFTFLHRRAGALQAQEVKTAERETKTAERLAAVYKAQLDDAEKRLKELAPQSQATDLAGLVDDLSRKLTATAQAGEALMPNRLVHLAQSPDGRSVVMLADKLLQLEAHGFVTRSYDKGEQVRVERIGQFPLDVVPTRRTLFLQTRGEVSGEVDMLPDTIHQIVGTLGPGNVCLFAPAPQVLIA